MSIPVFYIDPDGDVDLLLPHLEELATPLYGVSKYMSPAPGLNYRRSDSQYPSTSAQDCGLSAEAPASEEFQHYDEVPPLAESQPEPTDEAPGPDELPESQQNPESETLEIPADHCNADEELMVEEQDTTSTQDGKYVRIRVSSKHLTFASPHFKRNLQSGMLESQTLRSQGHVEFCMDEQDPGVMLIVLNILHGRTSQVPRTVDLDTLTKFAVMVDYLECHEAVEPFSDRWVENLKGDIPTTCSSELIQWLCISFTFHKQIQFQEVTLATIRLSRDVIQTLDLPIRESVVDKLNSLRQEALDRLLLALENLLDDFRSDRIKCTFECNAMRYGALVKEMSSRTLLFPRPQIPFLGYSIEDTTASVREIRDPKWCNGNNRSHPFYPPHCQSHDCKLTSHIWPIVSSINESLKGLSLEEFL
ncbi:hypothetical protein P154DRAFT_586617 [Amniculicola lignicola CBS 123094]|uniref:BTB domain-containing protein n=1 Tax=Amniculicola lignicola CBS 123094 TaxID=1392246 RepID=A0A6A5VXW0_9PLEO|nr:hypothetical protein P154DRAFT_586617 [Amniculicola lignicola CBS 123094]